jgi:hypothetical protein
MMWFVCYEQKQATELEHFEKDQCKSAFNDAGVNCKLFYLITVKSMNNQKSNKYLEIHFCH